MLVFVSACLFIPETDTRIYMYIKNLLKYFGRCNDTITWSDFFFEIKKIIFWNSKLINVCTICLHTLILVNVHLLKSKTTLRVSAKHNNPFSYQLDRHNLESSAPTVVFRRTSLPLSRRSLHFSKPFDVYRHLLLLIFC